MDLNNKIKVIKRISFGYRNFDHFRLRIFALTQNDCPITSL
jgi:transposase